MTSLLSPLFSSLSLHFSLLSFLCRPAPVSVLSCPFFQQTRLLFQSSLSPSLFYVLYLHTLFPTLWGPTLPLNFTRPTLLVYALPLCLFSICSWFFPSSHIQFNFHFLCRSFPSRNNIALGFFNAAKRPFVTASEAIGAWMTSSYRKERVMRTMQRPDK